MSDDFYDELNHAKTILMKKEFEALRHAKLAQGGGLLAGVGAQVRQPPRVYNYQEKMEMRMNWQPGRIPNCFAFIDYHMVGEKAFMWILTPDGQSVVLEDDHALFPSDALITKVRMMGG